MYGIESIKKDLNQQTTVGKLQLWKHEPYLPCKHFIKITGLSGKCTLV